MIFPRFRLHALALLGILSTGFVSFAGEEKLSGSDRRWLEREVAAFITTEEIEIFRELGSKKDRQRFKELFWLRRDPDLMTPKNEFREEYKRRVKYANRYFTQRGGVRGFTTDMGKVYLLLGFPASREEQQREMGGSEVFADTGLVSQTDTSSGALPEFDGADLASSIQAAVGTTLTRTWIYEPDPQVGLLEGLVIEFELQRGFGMRYRQPEEVAVDFERVKQSYVVHPGIDYARDSLGRLVELPLKFDPRSPAKKALREMMETRISRTDIEFETEMTYFRSPEGSYIPVRFEIDPERLSWDDSTAEVTIFGVIETMDGRPLRRFEEPAKLARTDDGPAVFDLPVQLPPGSYSFKLGILDDESGRVGTRRVPVFVRRFNEGKLDMSSVLLYTESRQVDEPPGRPGHSFQFGQVRFTPARGTTYRPTDTMGILFFVYGFGLNLNGQPDLTCDYTLLKDEEKFTDVLAQPLQAGPTQAAARLEFTMEDFRPGRYQVEIKVTDRVTNAVLTNHVEFSLEPELYPVWEYTELLDRYREGGFVEAAEALSRVSRESLERAAGDYRKGSLSLEELKAAALLHTEVAFRTRVEVLFHLESARDYLNRIEEDSLRKILLRQWYLAISSLLRGSMQSWGALHLIDSALDIFPDDLEILMAVGAVYETAGWMGVPRKLDRAEELYHRILATHPENLEVHLRMGRVMQLRGNGKEAVRELNWSLEQSTDPEIRFVAHMLLGDSCNQLGRLSEAIQSYRAAVEIAPNCQAAAVALSHALHRAGDRAGSREVINHFLNQEVNPPGVSDRWMRYLFGGQELLDSAMRETRKEFLR